MKPTEYGDVLDDNGKEVPPIDDDYELWKSECDAARDPLSDDYVREGYEGYGD